MPGTSAACSSGAGCAQPAGREFAKQHLNAIVTFSGSFEKAEVSRNMAAREKGEWLSMNEEIWYLRRSEQQDLQQMQCRQLLMNTPKSKTRGGFP